MSSITSGEGVEAEYVFRDCVLTVKRGRPLPLGAITELGGVNFAVVCRHATAVWLVLGDPQTVGFETEVQLDPRLNRTGDHWHVRIDGLPDEFCYGYRVDGPDNHGYRFDSGVILLDPYSRAVSCRGDWGDRSPNPRRSLINEAMTEREPVVGPGTPLEDTIVYELHVRGFTIHPNSGVADPGTFAGLAEKIDYLHELGVTAVELLPVDEFDETDCSYVNPFTGERLLNFWGYNTIAFSAPKANYAVKAGPSEAWKEFGAMVDAFHEHEVEVYLDIVFNHTAEGGDDGPTYSFRGFDNRLYYILDERGGYLNFSGCGNSFNTDHPIVRNFLLWCLRNWVAEAGVDGFRFDLASVLGRDRRGDVLVDPPTINRISEDSLLYGTKLIAEPWDAGGLYQVGTFPGGARWSDWNGRYRDDIRRFWRGDPGMTSALATRICGSDDLYTGRSPLHSINFITCHDGFTLLDLVSYDHKHNEANGEGNRDGNDANFSWNCGVEGPTDDPAVLEIRRRQVRNLMATLLISQGVPMILGGDEILRTQQGNNNAWCQDNPVSWVDWSLADANQDFLRFVRKMIALRKAHPVFRRRSFFGQASGSPPEIFWHGVLPVQPDFSPSSRMLAFALDGRRCDRPGVIDRDFFVAMNADDRDERFHIPASPSGRPWRRVVDTALASPDDYVEVDEGPEIAVMSTYLVRARSMIILASSE
ncbi:glycogen debranching protein GlgX [Paludisphaera rhizosphaerae]|uniref:glycogen debranching protein GlgX n=1 Tax=Paludisphaera rhizosphaerae TaxID=2711216 RepID=UPI00197FC8FC|nr:glycogen debranching protein GlgX [Paludisphaera rhizosphaerae]